ncbi:vWA domain-containing protein [Novosphingobium sp. JCM 18896]|uniref:vWA domain-containing protein n=1 Tax=Novosphingobium sp. JCM 18896 TaxID=2989731 RepID=UPI002222BAA4|nr:VWA domain-containing protein [Novosphingobium sp. JCM 18896]MCW1427794.1 VWA domain-containing protein [Novosphingobium sp. JCM 18896]
MFQSLRHAATWVHTWFGLVLGFGALCGCGGGSRDVANDDPSAALSDASASEIGKARAYLGPFTAENPDRCFADVGLDAVQLEARSSDGLGPRVPPVRVVVAIDGSGSMAGRIGGQTKIDLARDAATRFLDGLPSSVEASLIVFGQQGDNSEAGKAKSCAGVELLAPMSNDRARLGAAVSRVRAVGWTPLAAGLAKAEALLAPSSARGEQVIYVVSDGQETCGGDPVGTAQRINNGTTRAIINIIGFGLPSSEAAALKAVSDAGGGNFVNVNSRAEYDQTLGQVRESNRRASNAVQHSNAIASNAVQTSNTLSSAAVCVSNIVSSEKVRVSNDLAARAVRGENLPFERVARTLLKERHDAMELRLKRYRAQLQGNEAQVRKAIDAEANSVK